MDISVVIPLLNEAESLPELESWIQKVMNNHQFKYEIIFVDDGSTDNSWEIIKNLSLKNENIRGIKFRRNYGKSAALNTAFTEATGEVVITMDADLQDSPDEIPSLYKMIQNDGYHLVSGWKKKRYDPITKTLPTKLFNATTRKMSGIKLNDFNCGLKAYKKEVVKNLEVHGEMHRYIPVIAKWQGFTNIGEKVVEHRARKYGTTKFGIERFINGFLDLATIFFMSRFGKRPMHFFGLFGTISFVLGFLIALSLGVKKLIVLAQGGTAPLVADDPTFYIALAIMIIGTQLFLAGFLGELISKNDVTRGNYNITERI